MKTNEAILRRIEEICSEKGKNVCKARLSGGKSPSAIYDLMKGRTKCPKVMTVKSFVRVWGSPYLSFLIGSISTIWKMPNSR